MKIKLDRKRTLGTTILVAMVLLVVVTLLAVTVIYTMRLEAIQKVLVDYNGMLGDRAGEISSTSMEDEVTRRLMEIAGGQADIVDSNFSHFKATVELLAQDATYLYEHADEFGRIGIEEPKAENDGKLVVHITHSKNTDMTDEAVIDEAGLLGNESNTLLSAHAGNPSMAKCYIATESGLMIEADRDSSAKIAEDGSVMFYEASERPWYIGTKNANATFFTNVTPEANGKRIGMMCGSPVTKNGKFMGVACAGMYLDDVDELVKTTELGDTGIACIVNNQGQLLFSTEQSGELSITKETADLDLRDSSNSDLASLITDALNGLEAYRVVEVNGERYCVAFASMETVGWTFLIMLPEKTVQEPTGELMKGIEDVTRQAEEQTVEVLRQLGKSLLFTGVVVILLAFIMAYFISEYVVRPLRTLTEKVGKIEGDDLKFEWEDVKEEEIQTLAVSFKNMTQRMKEYIEEVTRITAEKEKIGAELSVATQIQADMLPRIFPPFPERKEFDLYATMDPAKEVGGDFYDFFLIDNDHLGLVVADVSGKGVPAALFMVIAKTLIKNRALLGGSPSEVLAYANEQLCEGNEAELFVTVWFAIVDIPTGKGIAANAGHEHPAIKRAGGKWELSVYRHSPAVATMEGIRFREHEFELHPGDALYVYTDGVPEATNINDELFGPERMLESLNRDPDADVEKMLASVKKDVDDFTGEAPQFDDITMLGLIWNGS